VSALSAGCLLCKSDTFFPNDFDNHLTVAIGRGGNVLSAKRVRLTMSQAIMSRSYEQVGRTACDCREFKLRS